MRYSASSTSSRRLALLLTGAAVGASVVAALAPGATATALATTTTTTVDGCDQNVPAGHYACLSERIVSTSADGAPVAAPRYAAADYGYSPAQLQAAYSLAADSATRGSGQRVYIVDAYDDPSAESDLAVYRSQFGLPACTVANGCFRKLDQDGVANSYPGPDAGWAGEEALDLDMVSAICPNCGITLIEADDDAGGLFDAVSEATDLGARFVSMSWGGDELSDDPSFDSYFAKPGVVYAAATGDEGYGVSYPSAAPDVVAVGGTSLSPSASGWTQLAWSTSRAEGTGSGCSAYEPRPSWQVGVVPPSACSQRAIADVSADADPYTGVAVYDSNNGGWGQVGGTSAATPIVTATFALAGTPSTSVAPGRLLYTNRAELTDVVGGSTGSCSAPVLCTAGAGWDGPTGLGTPDGLAAFTPDSTVTVLDPGAQHTAAGTTVHLAIAATSASGSALTFAASGLPTGLRIDPGTGVISGTPSGAGTFTVTVTITAGTHTGSTSFTWTVGSRTSPSCTGNLIANPGFESGAEDWSAGRSVIRDDGPESYSGRYVARLDGYGHRHTDSLAQTVHVPAGCVATLSFYERITSADHSRTAHDTLRLRIDGTTVDVRSNVDRSSHWYKYTARLNGSAGRTVTVRWIGTENGSLATAFYVDAVGVLLS